MNGVKDPFESDPLYESFEKEKKEVFQETPLNRNIEIEERETESSPSLVINVLFFGGIICLVIIAFTSWYRLLYVWLVVSIVSAFVERGN